MLNLTVIRVARNQQQVNLVVELNVRRGGIMGGNIHDVLQSSTSSPSPSSVVPVGTLPKFLNQ